MKTSLCRRFAIAASLIMTASQVSAAIITEQATYAPDLVIPDGSTLGAADTRNFVSEIAFITEVRVTLKVIGTPGSGDAFNGDIYAYLAHGTGFAVLLNRAGREASNDFGYAGSGFNVTFDDSPAGTDIHQYQLAANPGNGVLVGTWGSDGRNVSPETVRETTPRTALLTSFQGLDPDGDWTLFVADVSPLGTARFVSWQLEVTGDTVPEPSSALIAIIGGAALLAARRRTAISVNEQRTITADRPAPIGNSLV